MKLVAPTLAFWVYPTPFKSIDFTHRFRYGCNRFSKYGRSEQYDDKSHIMSVNMFEILKDITYIDSNKVLFDFNINLELSKWYCSRLRNATTFKIHMETGFNTGSSMMHWCKPFEMEEQCKFNYNDMVGDLNEIPGINKKCQIFAYNEFATYNATDIGCTSWLAMVYRYFECMAILGGPILVNMQFYKEG